MPTEIERPLSGGENLLPSQVGAGIFVARSARSLARKRLNKQRRRSPRLLLLLLLLTIPSLCESSNQLERCQARFILTSQMPEAFSLPLFSSRLVRRWSEFHFHAHRRQKIAAERAGAWNWLRVPLFFSMVINLHGRASAGHRC